MVVYVVAYVMVVPSTLNNGTSISMPLSSPQFYAIVIAFLFNSFKGLCAPFYLI